jgi:hypothetical protein
MKFKDRGSRLLPDSLALVKFHRTFGRESKQAFINITFTKLWLKSAILKKVSICISLELTDGSKSENTRLYCNDGTFFIDDDVKFRCLYLIVQNIWKNLLSAYKKTGTWRAKKLIRRKFSFESCWVRVDGSHKIDY